MKYKQKYFECYVCEEKKNKAEAGLSVGSGLFTYDICKTCSREKYAIYEDNYFKEMNKKFNKNNLSESLDSEEVLIRQRQFIALIDRMVDKMKEDKK